jgi:integrase
MKKECKFCEKNMTVSNLYKHTNRCVIRKTFNVSKSVILQKLGEFSDNEQSEMKEMQLKYAKLENFISKWYEEMAGIISQVKEPNNTRRLDDMAVSEYTLMEYKSEWKHYEEWCSSNTKDPLSSGSANSYLAYLKPNVKTTTLKKKRSRIKTILQFLLEKPVVLREIRVRNSITPKYSLSEQEIKDYLKEQKEINEKDYLIQLMLVTFGCRVHSLAGLKRKHLEFLRTGDKIFLPDTKTGTREVEVNQNLQRIITSHLDKNSVEEGDDFVFSSTHQELKRRAAQLCLRINQRIKASKVLKKSDNYVYSTHMFRKTKARNLYNQLVEDAKETVRKAIGQASNSTAIEHYI